MTMPIFRKISFCLLLSASAFGFAQGNSAAVDDQTIEKFSDAYESIISIQQKYSQQLQGVQDREKAQTLQTKAQDEMASAIEDSGLTVAEYNDVVSKMRGNPDLESKILESIN